MKKFLAVLVIITLMVVFLFLRTTIYKSCLFGGCYGPFELVIKAEDGKHIEDIVVELTFVKPSGEGTTHTYNEVVLANTDEIVHFPRGYIAKTKDTGFSLILSIYHPDYLSLDMYASFNKKDGVINLEDKTLISNQKLHEQSLERNIIYWRKEGLSEKEIDEKLEGERMVSPSISLSYFEELTALGRTDLVKKILPVQLKAVIEYKGYSKEQAIALEKKVRMNVKEGAARL